MFNLGFGEMLVIGVITLLVLGPEKLPMAMKTVSEWITKLRRSMNDIKYQVNNEFEKAAGEDFKQSMNEIKSIGSEINHFKTKGAKGLMDFIEPTDTEPAKDSKTSDNESKQTPDPAANNADLVEYEEYQTDYGKIDTPSGAESTQDKPVPKEQGNDIGIPTYSVPLKDFINKDN